MTKVLLNVETEFSKQPPESFKGEIKEWYYEIARVLSFHLIKARMGYAYSSKDTNTVIMHPETLEEYGVGIELLGGWFAIIENESELILDDKMEKDTIRLERLVHNPYDMNVVREKTLRTGEIDMNDFKVKESPQLINITINIK